MIENIIAGLCITAGFLVFDPNKFGSWRGVTTSILMLVGIALMINQRMQ